MKQVFKKTKIVCTIGPATDSEETLRLMAENGMNVARFNNSHGLHEEHQRRLERLRKVEKDLQKPIGILWDLSGPKIRLGVLERESQRLEKGSKISLSEGKKQVDATLPVNYEILPYIKVGDHVMINDGIIKLRVDKVYPGGADCTALTSGELRSNKGVNLPDTVLPNLDITDKDKEDLEFGLSVGFDYLAVSFIQNAEDIRRYRKFCSERNKFPKIITKVELKEAIKNIKEIVEESDGIMIARGDMAVEVGQEEVPINQRKIIRLCREYKKPVIVATQMLESMIHNAEPTRAEVNDVATAVLDQADAVMLSAESAHGDYPVETVMMMERIIKRTEKYFKEIHDSHEGYKIIDDLDQTEAIASATALLAHQLDAQLIFTLTATGRTVREVSTFRPISPIIAITDNEDVYKQLTLVWGVKSYLVPKISSNETTFEKITDQIEEKGYLSKGDRIIVVSGMNPGKAGHTNSIEVMTIE